MKTLRGCLRKYIVLSVILVIMSSFFVSNINADSNKGDIYFYSNRWERFEPALKNIFMNYNVLPMESDPIYYLNNGAKAVEVMDSEYGFLEDNYYKYPLFKLSPVIAINRNSTDVNIETWSDLLKYDLTVGVEEYGEYLVLGMNQGLSNDKSNLNKSKKLLEEIKAKGNLFFPTKEGFSISNLPDVVILFDNHGKYLNFQGANLELIIPTEGTVSFEYSLFSNEPLDFDNEVLIEELEKLGNNTNTSMEDEDVIPINSSIYLDIIRAESMFNRKLIKPFRPLRTNKFENSITFVLLFLAIGMLSVYFYFRITSKKLRNYLFLVFSILCFWIIVRLTRLLISNSGIVHRYTWYLYYVALIYIPMLFIWISFTVEESLEEKKFSKFRKISFVYSSALLLFVLTNDLHNLVFKFHDNYDDYSFNYIMVAIFLHYLFSIFLSFGILIKKSIKMPKRKQLVIPSILILSLLIYIIIFNIYLNNKIAVELTKAVSIFVILISLFSMRFGLIPINRKHIPIFQKSTISLEIRNNDDEIVLKSQREKNYEKFILKRKPIKGGYSIWYEDITFLDSLLKKEEELTKRLEENIEILTRRYEVGKNLETLSKKEELQKTVEDTIQDDLVQLDKEIKLLDSLDSKERKEKLKILALEFVRLKYISNLLILSLTDNKIKGEDLLIYFNSLCKIVKNVGINCNIYNNKDGNLTFVVANKMLDWFVESLINSIGTQKEISCITYFDEYQSTLMLYTDKEKIDFNPFLPSSNTIKKSRVSQDEIKVQENEFLYKGTMKIRQVIL